MFWSERNVAKVCIAKAGKMFFSSMLHTHLYFAFVRSILQRKLFYCMSGTINLSLTRLRLYCTLTLSLLPVLTLSIPNVVICKCQQQLQWLWDSFHVRGQPECFLIRAYLRCCYSIEVSAFRLWTVWVKVFTASWFKKPALNALKMNFFHSMK